MDKVQLANIFYHFLLLMLRRPPRPTLFPTRRSSDLVPPQTRRCRACHRAAAPVLRHCRGFAVGEDAPRIVARLKRSEEHTSELQSRGHLVCRLLLEKKKQLRETL